MSIETLFKIGHADAARKFMKFIQSTFVAEHDTYQIMYAINGNIIKIVLYIFELQQYTKQ